MEREGGWKQEGGGVGEERRVGEGEGDRGRVREREKEREGILESLIGFIYISIVI